MSDKHVLVLILLGVIAFAAMCYVKVQVWEECEAENHSFEYCWQLISK